MSTRIGTDGTTSRSARARWLWQHRHDGDRGTVLARGETFLREGIDRVPPRETEVRSHPARSEELAASAGWEPGSERTPREFLEGMRPGDARDPALHVLEREANQPYRTWWLTSSWYPPRREELRHLLGERLTHQEALALSDLLYRRISYDVVVAFLAEKPRPEWFEFAKRAQAALDKARAEGAVRPLAGAKLLEPGWFLQRRGMARGPAAA